MASLVDKTAVAGAASGLRALPFTLILIAVAIAIFAVGRWIGSSYAFFMGYVVVQYIVLGTAWNILGGYTGYVNFGITAFFTIGAYSSVVLHKLTPVTPLPVMIAVGGVLAGLVGLGTGYLTLRLRGVYFSIATLALAVVVQTLITNWDFVGGARGAYVLRPRVAPLIGGTSTWLGPVVGALLVGGLQEYIRVTISSAVNVLVAGVLLVAFVIVAPQGIVGLFQRNR